MPTALASRFLRSCKRISCEFQRSNERLKIRTGAVKAVNIPDFRLIAHSARGLLNVHDSLRHIVEIDMRGIVSTCALQKANALTMMISATVRTGSPVPSANLFQLSPCRLSSQKEARP